MTKIEFDEVMKELQDHVKRTSFPATYEDDDDAHAFTHADHVEYGAAAH